MAKRSTGSKELARLTPASYEVTLKDGNVIFVAGNAQENQILNFILAGQVRALMEKNLKMYVDLERPLTPREMKEMADAARSLAEFSATVYQGPESAKLSEKKADSIPVDATDFSALTKKDGNNPSKEDPRPAGAGEVAGGG